MTTIIVLAKSPVTGRVKTRLCPPLRFEQAAAIAEAALVDTLRAVAHARVANRYVVLEGEPGPWLDHDIFRWLPQRSGDLGDRLTHAFRDVFNDLAERNVGQQRKTGARETGARNSEARNSEACVVIAMDTPQVTAEQLEKALHVLTEGGKSVVGPARDGGYWLLGLVRPDPRVFVDIPMSVSHTGAVQVDRLRSLDLAPVIIDELRDIDEFADLDAVAEEFPHLLVTGVWRTLRQEIV
jgi:uncharacterized protein